MLLAARAEATKALLAGKRKGCRGRETSAVHDRLPPSWVFAPSPSLRFSLFPSSGVESAGWECKFTFFQQQHPG